MEERKRREKEECSRRWARGHTDGGEDVHKKTLIGLGEKKAEYNGPFIASFCIHFDLFNTYPTKILDPFISSQPEKLIVNLASIIVIL